MNSKLNDTLIIKINKKWLKNINIKYNIKKITLIYLNEWSLNKVKNIYWFPILIGKISNF